MGLLGWVDALAMKPRRGSSRPRRAWTSSGVQSSLIKNGQHYEEVYKGIVLCVACTQGSYHLATEWSKQVNGRTIFLKNGVIYVKITLKHHDFERLLSVRGLVVTAFFF